MIEIDARVQSLVDALDELPGLITMSSCGGHADPGPCQAPEGEFYVCFQPIESKDGWRSLEILSFAADQSGAGLTAWFSGDEFFEGGLAFELRGADGLDPDLLAREILELYGP